MNNYLIINHATKKKVIVEANSEQEAAQKVGCRIAEAKVINIGQPKLNGMPIPKAIEILTLMGTPEFNGHTQDILLARKLGIEALKAYKTSRQFSSIHHVPLLPGETEK